jgi:NADH:ubiquinone oxidoreductase subunit F (NADH-binding)
MTVGRAMVLGAYPGVEPRLLTTDGEPEDATRYRARGGYAPEHRTPAEVLDAIESAGLRGRGGGAFPTAAKLRAVADRSGPRFVVANGEEGEPACVKDRWLLRSRPHLVLDGLRTVIHAVDAAAAYIYVSDHAAQARMLEAMDELDRALPVPIDVVRVDKGYVAGEETAAVRAIDGGPALPVDKPPRPFESGVNGGPTAVVNVETLANIPSLLRDGTLWRDLGGGAPARPHVGTNNLGFGASAGTFLCTITGACSRPGLYELPLGVPLGAALRACAGMDEDPRGFVVGGFFGGVLAPRHEALQLGYDEARRAGTGLGCGAIVVLGPEDCPVGAVADILAYLERENAQQCGPCIRGTVAMRDAAAALMRGTADAALIERLEGWSLSLPGRGACGLLDAAAAVAGSLMREFPGEVASHLAQPCGACTERVADPERFTVELAFD